MCILIVSRKKIQFANLLKKAGNSEKIILLTSSNNESWYEGNYEYIQGFENFDKNTEVELKAIELSEKYNFTKIVSTSEYDILLAARLRNRLGLLGQGIHSATVFRDKVTMKEFASAAVQVPKFKRINSVQDIFDFINLHGYPVVIKPIDGAGAINTYIVHDQTELSFVLKQGSISNYEIEQFIEGQMYTIDGLFRDGQIVFAAPGMYINDCLSYKDGKRPALLLLSNNNPLNSRLKDFINQLLVSLPMPQITSFHAEVFHTLDNELILCEIASRTGGGGHNKLAIHRYGINMTEAWILGQCGLLNDLVPIDNNKIFADIEIPPQDGTLISLPDSIPFEWVTEFEFTGKIGTKYSNNDILKRVGLVIINAETEEEAVIRINKVIEWANKTFVYSSDATKPLLGALT